MSNGTFPDGWQALSLGDVAQYINGRAFKPEEWKNKGLPIIRIQNLNDPHREFNYFDGTCEEKYYVDTGDILISWSASLGVYIWNRGPAFLNQHIFKVLPDESIVEKRYFVYAVQTILEEMKSRVHGSTMRHIVKHDFQTLKIPVPSLSEQRLIADVLDRAKELQNLRENANQLTNKIIQSVFLKMFGDIAANDEKWESSTASEIFDMQLGKPLSAKEYTGKHLKPYLRNVNVQWGFLDLSDIKKMDFDDEEFQKYQLKKGDVLVCEGGEVGRTAIYDGEIQNCCYQKALHRLRIRKPVITKEYFVYYMQFAAKYGLLLRDTSQVTIAHFTAEKFREFRILLPPISLQNQFASFVERMKSIRANQNESTEEIKKLLGSLMQKAFRGELAA